MLEKDEFELKKETTKNQCYKSKVLVVYEIVINKELRNLVIGNGANV